MQRKSNTALTGCSFSFDQRLTVISENGVPPPGAIISARKMINDPRAEPQYRERVPYVVKAGAPGARLADRVISPEELLADKYSSSSYIFLITSEMRLDAEYYITKTLIPPLERIFNLVGANVRVWYEEMPKVRELDWKEYSDVKHFKRRSTTSTLHSFVRSRLCAICNIEETDEGTSF